MIRLLVLLIIGFLSAKAEDTLLLNANIRMIPKIMALDTQVLSHSSSNKVILGVIYDEKYKNNAKKIAEDINIHHNGKVGILPFIAMAISVDELLTRHDIAFVYLMQTSKNSVSKVAAWGISNNVPTFSYDVTNLDSGILGAIVIERSTVIYLNKNVLKLAKFRFNDSLLQIARLINEPL